MMLVKIASWGNSIQSTQDPERRDLVLPTTAGGRRKSNSDDFQHNRDATDADALADSNAATLLKVEIRVRLPESDVKDGA